MKRRHVRLGALRRVSELNISFNGKTGRNVHWHRISARPRQFRSSRTTSATWP